MKVLTAVATIGLLLAPLAVHAKDRSDPFRSESKAQREARKADLEDRREHEERAAELQEQHEIDHPAMLYDDEEDKDDLEE